MCMHVAHSACLQRSHAASHILRLAAMASQRRVLPTVHHIRRLLYITGLSLGNAAQSCLAQVG